MRDEPAVVRRRARSLGTEEALQLLGSVPVGRVVFSHEAMPAIRPVNHLVDDGKVIIRTHEGAAIIPAMLRQAVVAYEAADIDSDHRTGWSVIVTGMARFVTDPKRVATYHQRLHPWIDRAMDHVIEISPGRVTGIRLD
ncbi:pyridoxamine 5'-phosphate oxidase family protein [Flindersiella endophytica]